MDLGLLIQIGNFGGIRWCTENLPPDEPVLKFKMFGKGLQVRPSPATTAAFITSS